VSRCTGHCCRRFTVSAPLEEIQRRRNADVCPPGETWIQDGDKLAEMLIPLETTTREDGSTAYWFTCKHHDATSGDCTDYENRPRMCREYPYGRDCLYDECTMEASGLVQLRIEREDVPR